MLKEIRPAVVMILFMTGLTGFAYPLAMTGASRVLFPHQADGSLILKGGKVVGSELIGQGFSRPGYFHGRPSATTDVDPKDPARTVAAPYNAANSSGSNAGPTARTLAERVKADIQALREENPDAPVPADLVTTSASGLDPDISPEAALFQVPRVARERGLDPDKLRSLIDRHTSSRMFSVLGEPRVNVLKLNMALDALSGR
jgi:potassium-transporting ATPase KdpC subunit